jgi:MraZ protein
MSDTEPKPPIMYLSSFLHGLDDKRRAPVPAPWRSDGESTKLMLVIWPKHKAGTCLRGMPEHEFAKLVADIDALPRGDANKGTLRRFIGRGSVQITLDKAGRAVIPDDFAKAADIKDEALFVGCIKYFEIWNPSRHDNAKVVDEVITPEALELMD